MITPATSSLYFSKGPSFGLAINTMSYFLPLLLDIFKVLTIFRRILFRFTALPTFLEQITAALFKSKKFSVATSVNSGVCMRKSCFSRTCFTFFESLAFLGSKPLSSFFPTVGNHPAAALGFHFRSKSMGRFFAFYVRLIFSFCHNFPSGLIILDFRF